MLFWRSFIEEFTPEQFQYSLKKNLFVADHNCPEIFYNLSIDRILGQKNYFQLNGHRNWKYYFLHILDKFPYCIYKTWLISHFLLQEQNGVVQAILPKTISIWAQKLVWICVVEPMICALSKSEPIPIDITWQTIPCILNHTVYVTILYSTASKWVGPTLLNLWEMFISI